MIDVRDRLRAYAGGKPVCMDTVSSACQAGIDEIDRLRAKNARLREALECLIDEQNGPPLEARAHSWQMAIDRACAELDEEEKKG